MKNIKTFENFKDMKVSKEDVFTQEEINNLPEDILDGMISHTCPKCGGKYKTPCDLCEGQGCIYYRE